MASKKVYLVWHSGNLAGVCSTLSVAAAMRGYVADMEECEEEVVQIKEELVDHPLVDRACEAP
jgi:hypothetical protein